MVKKKATKARKKSAKKSKVCKIEIDGDKIEKCIKSKCKTSHSSCGGCSGFAYFLGFLGAAIYYISNATGFWNGVWGFIKAIVWPAPLIFELMKFIGM